MSHDDEHITRLYKKLDRHEPPAMIDARIRKQALDQLKRSRSSSRFNWFSSPWLSVAAVLVLSVMLVSRVIEEVPQTKPMDDLLQEMEKKQLPRPLASPPPDTASSAAVKIKAGKSPVEMQRPAPQHFEADIAESAQRLKRKPLSKMQKPEVSSVAGFSADKNTENLCGLKQFNPKGTKDAWLLRIKQLQAEDRFEQANCLNRAFMKRFKVD